MERSIFLACLWLTLIGIIQGDTIGKSRVRHLFVQRRSPIPGSPKKLFELAHEVENKLQSSSDQSVHKLLSRVRRSLNPDMKPSVNEFKLNDSHYMAYVHYNRETIVLLTRDRIPGLHSNSHVWISKNYGHSFQNRSSLFTLRNGSSALINMFHVSPVDDSKYLFVDKRHKVIFSTRDDCSTFVRSSPLSFSPDEILFHPSSTDVVLSYDENTSKLYYSVDFGSNWRLKDENVRSYYWGIPPWDTVNTLYIEREEITGIVYLLVNLSYC